MANIYKNKQNLWYNGYDKPLKVYTVNHESRYLLVKNIPDLNTFAEFKSLLTIQPEHIEEFVEQHSDQFTLKYTNQYLLKFKDLNSCRLTKKRLDDYLFYSSYLKADYYFEDETYLDYKAKLLEFKQRYLNRLAQLKSEANEPKVLLLN